MSRELSLEFEIEQFIHYHPYRHLQPWRAGGKMIARGDYTRTDAWGILERNLAESTPSGTLDNHHGFTFKTESGLLLHVAFSDWRWSLWLMPSDWDAKSERKANRVTTVTNSR